MIQFVSDKASELGAETKGESESSNDVELRSLLQGALLGAGDEETSKRYLEKFDSILPII